jgi:hypothetical protein
MLVFCIVWRLKEAVEKVKIDNNVILNVIPAKAGIQSFLDSRLCGNDTYVVQGDK